jgi:hypothetical protein
MLGISIASKSTPPHFARPLMPRALLVAILLLASYSLPAQNQGDRVAHPDADAENRMQKARAELDSDVTSDW